MAEISKAKQLLIERDGIDSKIEELLAVLAANKSTMDSPLVDAEGYPISEIDVYAVRHARHDLICLRNDRELLTEKIAKEMEAAHELAASHRNQDQGHDENKVETVVHRSSNEPFVKVSEVTEHSPSHKAGIRLGDHIVQYGSLHFGNFTALKQIAGITADSENKIIRVTVLRDSHPIRLELKPQKWSGPGLLGCKIVPISGTQI